MTANKDYIRIIEFVIELKDITPKHKIDYTAITNANATTKTK